MDWWVDELWALLGWFGERREVGVEMGIGEGGLTVMDCFEVGSRVVCGGDCASGDFAQGAVGADRFWTTWK